MATTPWEPWVGSWMSTDNPTKASTVQDSIVQVPWFLLATGMIYRHCWIHIWAEFHLFISWILLVLSRVLYDLAFESSRVISFRIFVGALRVRLAPVVGSVLWRVWYWDSAVSGAVQGMCRKCAVRWRVLRVSTMKLRRFGQISREPSSNTQCWFVLCLWLFDFAKNVLTTDELRDCRQRFCLRGRALHGSIISIVWELSRRCHCWPKSLRVISTSDAMRRGFLYLSAVPKQCSSSATGLCSYEMNWNDNQVENLEHDKAHDENVTSCLVSTFGWSGKALPTIFPSFWKSWAQIAQKDACKTEVLRNRWILEWEVRFRCNFDVFP